MTRLNKEYTKYRRTKSWKSNPEYDKFLACSSMSDLVFLKQKREKDMNYFKKNHNLANPNSFSDYKVLQQTYKMICEELKFRYLDMQSESNAPIDDIESVYKEEDNGDVYLYENEFNDKEDYTDYELCDESIKYDWKQWCKKKGLDKSGNYE